MFSRPRQIARGLVSSDQIWFLALGVIACSISAHRGDGYVARLCEAHDCGRFRYHLARENYLPLPIATFLFASDIPQKELLSIDKGSSGLGKEIRKTYALM